MKNRILKIYLEKTSDMGTVKRLDRMISLLEEFTGWTFVLDEYLKGHWRMGVLPANVSLGSPGYHKDWVRTKVKVDNNDFLVTAAMDFSEAYPSLEPISNILERWCLWALYTLGETTTSITMKLQLRGLEKPEEIT